MKRKIVVSLVAMLFALGLFSVPVLARDGTSGSDDNTTTTQAATTAPDDSTTQTTTHENSSDTTKTERQKQVTKVEQEADDKAKSTQEDGLETEAKLEVASLLKVHDKHTDSDRQKACQAAEQGLETKLGGLATNSTSFQTKIDTALNLAIGYQKDQNVTVANFDQLVAAAQAAKAKAAASVTVLNGLSPNLDCSQNTVATNLAKFKVATKQAKTDLLAYKEAVKAVLRALEDAKAGN